MYTVAFGLVHSVEGGWEWGLKIVYFDSPPPSYLEGRYTPYIMDFEINILDFKLNRYFETV